MMLENYLHRTIYFSGLKLSITNGRIDQVIRQLRYTINEYI